MPWLASREACALLSHVGLCTSSGKGDRQTDRQRQTRPEPDRPTRPTPKHPHELTDTVLASTLLERDPKTLPAWKQRWLTKNVRASCFSLVEKKFNRPLSPGAGQKPFPQLYPYSVGWEARRPLEPHGQPRKGQGITCKKNVWPQSQKQRLRDKRVRAENLKASSPCATRHQTRERKTQAAPKNRKKTMAPRPLGAQKQSV